ncbi:hypothetical protein [Tahibacter amnicola]|uniref:Calcium-binding protein n=1 Tax=Tahibacter amnicola TaxID=2976241 RepID=A0ABY6B925_9GAMM|nr:hypothetical protein [Tahibacter amnicola]UXI66287.1 hypothetical protein N4264_16190 [Tahibacter amnicola]
MRRSFRGWLGLAVLVLAVAGIAPAKNPPPPNSQTVSDAALHRLAELAARHPLLVIGEIHGTTEAPAVVQQLAARLSARQPLLVALEWPETEQERVDHFLASAGDADAVQQLTRSWFWQESTRDGRTSQAMLALLDDLRRRAQQGAKVRVVCFDWNWQAQPEGDRDAALAERLRKAFADRGKATMLVLTGNYHARMSRGAPWNPEQEFAAYHLRDLSPYNVDIRARSGSAWVCLAGEPCGARALGGTPDAPLGLTESAELDADGYRARLTLPVFTASAPAVPAPGAP